MSFKLAHYPTLKVIDANTQQVIFEKGPYQARPYGVEFSPDGHWIVTSTHIGAHAESFIINVETQESKTLIDDEGVNLLLTFDATGLRRGRGRSTGCRVEGVRRSGEIPKPEWIVPESGAGINQKKSKMIIFFGFGSAAFRAGGATQVGQ